MKRVVIIFFIAITLAFAQTQGAKQVLDGENSGIPSGSGLIHLKYKSFDPLAGDPYIPASLQATSDNPVKLVHVRGPMTSEWIRSLEKQGVMFISFLQDFTYITLLNPELEAHVSALPEVLWVGDFHPAYKIQQGLLGPAGRNEVNILVWPDFRGQSNKAVVKEKIQDLVNGLTYSDDVSMILRARLTADQIVALTGLPEVHWIDRYTQPQTAMNLVRQFTGADTAASGGGFDGNGIVGQVKDNGCDTGHQDFDNLIGTYGSVSTQAHGTCTFGIVFSTHTGNAKGMMYNGGGVFCDWGQSRSASISNLKNTWGGVFESNSWFMTYTLDGDYSSYSYDNDAAVNNYDVSMLYAAANSDYGVGSETISQDSAAKNVICVGAVYHWDTVTLTDDEWVNYGSGWTPCQGPAADGRIKPDICGVFDDIYTTDVRGGSGYSSGDYYSSFGGTSGATPICAGGLGLIYQMYEENHFGNNPGGSTPHTATVKAMLIANAYQYSLSDATRYQQGWGLVDVGQAYNAATDQLIVDGGDALSTGNSTTYYVQWINSSTPMKFVLCWSDEPGETSSSKALINDLDLTVTAPNSAVYRGNVGLTGNLYSTSGGSSDRLNNVECVFIQSPVAGNYEITVNAYNIAQDNDPAGGVNQAYSLVVSECNTILGNLDPELTNPVVTPPSGYYGTLFEYRVHYYDADGDAPTLIQVNIDGVNHNMTLDSGSADNGTYRYTTRDMDPHVSHTYYFYAEEGEGGSGRNPSSGTLNGPTSFDPEMYLNGTPAAGAWMTIEMWGAVDALWSAAWSSEGGPHYVPVTGLWWDIGPGDLRMAKRITADPVHLDAFGYGSYDFKIPNATTSGTKYIQGGTKMNAYWGQTSQEVFIIP